MASGSQLLTAGNGDWWMATHYCESCWTINGYHGQQGLTVKGRWNVQEVDPLRWRLEAGLGSVWAISGHEELSIA